MERMVIGDCWLDMAADPSCGYSEHYVDLNGRPLPVGVMIARELLEEGALIAFCTDLTHGVLRLINADLVCVEAPPQLADILMELRVANGNSYRGLPDAISIFPDGKIVLREAKRAKKDRLNVNQHSFARAARSILGSRLDLAVVEWGYESV